MKNEALLEPRVELGHDWKGGLLWILCAVLALGYLDKWDNEVYWREKAREAEQREMRGRPLHDELRTVTFVIQAKTNEDLMNRLADVAGAADLERHYLRATK